MKNVISKVALHGGEHQNVTGYIFNLTPAGYSATVPVLVHRPIGCPSGGWAVTDFTTGYNMVRDRRTINMALDEAKQNLARRGEISYNWMVEQVMRNRDHPTPMPPVVRDAMECAKRLLKK